MKATGEVMAIAPNLEAGLMKAIRSLEENMDSFIMPGLQNLEKEEILQKLKDVDNDRIFVIAEAIRREISVEQIHEITTIDRFFIGAIYKIVRMENELMFSEINSKMLLKAKKLGFTDKVIANLSGKAESEILKMREENGIFANFKMVDTCAAEFEARTPYYYSSYDEENEAKQTDNKKIMVLRFWSDSHWARN